MNVSKPESTLQKKHNAINYHAVCEAAAAGILGVEKEDWRNELSGFIDKVVDETTTMAFMPLSDVVMFGAHSFPLSLISRSTAWPDRQVVTSQAGSASD